LNTLGNDLAQGALRLHAYLARHHLRGDLLAGPDAGIRFNLRLWRFAKSALGLRQGPERHVFTQGMAYWVLANGRLYDLRRDPGFLASAVRGADALLGLQREDGSWPYPLRERRHLVATIEGNWAALALLDAFRRTGDERHRQGALRWKRFLLERIGFQDVQGTRAVNYFDKPRGNVPNNSTNTLWFFSELASVDPDPALEEGIQGMKAFLRRAQTRDGEFPYILASPYEAAKAHYLCYQYNAFQFLDLAAFHQKSRDPEVLEMLRALAGFLDRGMDEENGLAKASCLTARPFVLYHTAAVAAALRRAYRLGLLPSEEKSLRGCRALLDRQRPDGSFPYSFADYGFLRDDRSYPRPLAMILYFLLILSE